MDAGLYCVATPIGNLGDITQRAVKVLADVDLVYAEDTRVTRKLLTHLGISQSLRSLHEHNEAERVAEIRAAIMAGQAVALVSDAGTPLISDPGYQLVQALRADGIRVMPVPGVSAVITALSAAGLPTDRFAFDGFLPAKSSQRKKVLEALGKEARTVVFYESSHRIEALLVDMIEVLGEDRQLVIARELTKLYEQFYQGTVAELLLQLRADDNMRRGEFVVMLAGYNAVQNDEANTVLASEQLLMVLLTEGLPVKQAAKIAARLTGQSKNTLYRQAMDIARQH